MNNRTNIFLIAGAIVLMIGLVIAGAALLESHNGQTSFVSTVTAPITASDHAKGDTSSKVSVIEYGDFECPACGAYEPMVEQLEAYYGNKVEFVFRNFPLTQIHPNAQVGAEAAEAAGLQGKYWEMHDLLYSKQNDWATAAHDTVVATYFDVYATSLGLDVKKFDADINSTAVTEKIQDDVTSATNAQVDHTPTFFINLKQIQNPSYDQFKSAIDAALAGS